MTHEELEALVLSEKARVDKLASAVAVSLDTAERHLNRIYRLIHRPHHGHVGGRITSPARDVFDAITLGFFEKY